MKRRVLALALAGMLSLGVLAGCSKEEVNQEETTEETSEEAESTEGTEDETDTIRVATGGSYALFSQTNEDGELEGIEIEIWNEIGERLGREIEWVIEPFSAQFGDLDNGRVDTIAQQISITDERKEKYEFSTVYFYSPLYVTVSANNTDIQSFDDLKGKTIGAGSGGIALSIIQNNDPDGEVNVSMYADGPTMYKDVDMERCDACLLSAITLEQTNENNGTNLKQVGEPIYVEEDAYPFAKTERGDIIREQVSRVIEEMIEDGTITEISQKWCGIDPFEVAE